MAGLLKQSTQATIMMGVFVDKTDGNTPETGLTIAQADVLLSKNGGAQAQKGDAGSAVHDQGGDYMISLSTIDTGTLGRLRARVHKSADALPAWKNFLVVPANVYDSIVSGSDKLQVDTQELGGDSGKLTALKNAIDTDSDLMRSDMIRINQSTVGVDTLQTILSNSPTFGVLSMPLDAIWVDSGSAFSGSALPDGTPARPVNNLADALAIAAANNLTKIIIVGSGVSFNAAANGYSFVGIGRVGIDINGQTIQSCKFENLAVEGDTVGDNNAFEGCGLDGSGYDWGNNTRLRNCYSAYDATVLNVYPNQRFENYRPHAAGIGIDCANLSTGNVVFIGGKGDIDIVNLATAGTITFIGWDGDIAADASCSAGTINFFECGGRLDYSAAASTVNRYGKNYTGSNIHSQVKAEDLDIVAALTTIDANVDSIKTTVDANSVAWGAVASGVTVTNISDGALSSIDAKLSTVHGSGSWEGDVSLASNCRIKSVSYDDFGNPTHFEEHFYANATDAQNDENATKIVDVTTTYVADEDNEDRFLISSRLRKDITP